MKIDSANHEFIIEDLDDQTLVVKEDKLKELKQKLDAVCAPLLIMAPELWFLAAVSYSLWVTGIGRNTTDARRV